MQLKQAKTSADYGRIEQLGLVMAEQARAGRESAMLDFASLDLTWRQFEGGCQRYGYNVFRAWEDVVLRAHQLRLRLHWMSATNLAAIADPFVETAMRDGAELREKNKAYGESWKRRGGISAFMMLARKWDRIDNILSSFGGEPLAVQLGRNPGDVLDDIGDLRRYLLLVEDEALRLGDLPHYGHNDEAYPSLLSPSEAIYGFVGKLTTLADPVTMGSGQDAARPAELASAFCRANRLPEPREGWTAHLAEDEVGHGG